MSEQEQLLEAIEKLTLTMEALTRAIELHPLTVKVPPKPYREWGTSDVGGASIITSPIKHEHAERNTMGKYPWE